MDGGMDMVGSRDTVASWVDLVPDLVEEGKGTHMGAHTLQVEVQSTEEPHTL